MTTAALVVVASALSVGAAGGLFAAWDCNNPSGAVYTMPGVDHLSFGSPETREIASEVEPFIDKNTQRIKAEGRAYEDAATRSFTSALARRRADLRPRTGERLVIAEADTQGSFVGVHVRTALYDALAASLGPGAISLRTIAGDVSSNGTVAEAAYIKAEAKVGGDIPVAAVGGDHDSTRTWQQMADDGIELPDFDTVEVDGLRVSGAHDREHKALFGVLVTNEEGVTEEELGARGPDRGRRRLGQGSGPDRAAAPAGCGRRIPRSRRPHRRARAGRQPDRAVRRRHPRPAARRGRHGSPARHRRALGPVEHRRRRGHLDRRRPAGHGGWRGERTHVQPVLHTRVSSPEGALGAAAVPRRRVRAGDRLR